MLSAPTAWNQLQTVLQHPELISISAFKNGVKGMEEDSTGVDNCFLSQPNLCNNVCFCMFYTVAVLNSVLLMSWPELP